MEVQMYCGLVRRQAKQHGGRFGPAGAKAAGRYREGAMGSEGYPGNRAGEIVLNLVRSL